MMQHMPVYLKDEAKISHRSKATHATSLAVRS